MRKAVVVKIAEIVGDIFGEERSAGDLFVGHLVGKRKRIEGRSEDEILKERLFEFEIPALLGFAVRWLTIGTEFESVDVLRHAEGEVDAWRHLVCVMLVTHDVGAVVAESGQDRVLRKRVEIVVGVGRSVGVRPHRLARKLERKETAHRQRDGAEGADSDLFSAPRSHIEEPNDGHSAEHREAHEDRDVPVADAVIAEVDEVHAFLVKVSSKHEQAVRDDRHEDPTERFECTSEAENDSADGEDRADDAHLAKEVVRVEPPLDEPGGSLGDASCGPLFAADIPEELSERIGVTPCEGRVRGGSVGKPDEDEEPGQESEKAHWYGFENRNGFALLNDGEQHQESEDDLAGVVAHRESPEHAHPVVPTGFWGSVVGLDDEQDSAHEHGEQGVLLGDEGLLEE